MTPCEFRLPSASPGRSLRVLFWEPDGKPEAVLQLVHGMAEHIGRYDAAARDLMARGIAVIGHDHLGHGKTAQAPEDLGFFSEGDGSEILIRDAETVTREAKRRFPGIPVFLAGHSMGSFIVRRYLPLYGEEIAGAVILGTGWFPVPAARTGLTIARTVCRTRGERAYSALLDSLVLGRNTKAFPEDGPLGGLTRNREIIPIYEADPLCGIPFTAGAYRDFFAVMLRVAARDGYAGIRRSLPILVMSGERDPVGGRKAVMKTAAEYASLGFSDVKAKIFPGDRHEILNEDDRDAVIAFLGDWVLARAKG